MTYFNLNKVGGSDPLVNESSILNDNWDQLETKLGVYITGGALLGLEVGQELINSSRIGVWTGAATRYRDDIDSGWSALTTIPLAALITANTTNTPLWRVNTLIRKVQLFGQVIYNGGVSWPRGVYQTINSLAVPNNIPVAYRPTYGFHRQDTATAVPATEAAMAAVAIADSSTEPQILSINLKFLGANPSNPQYIVLDGIEWWY